MQSALFKPKQQQVMLLILYFVGISQQVELNAMLMPHLHPHDIKVDIKNEIKMGIIYRQRALKKIFSFTVPNFLIL
jgi:hypothetical protein